MQASNPEGLLQELVSAGGEKEWIEFKVDNKKPETIGQLISALSNSAKLHQRNRAFIAWGVENKSLNLVGTKFDPYKARVKGQELENWLTIHTLLD